MKSRDLSPAPSLGAARAEYIAALTLLSEDDRLVELRRLVAAFDLRLRGKKRVSRPIARHQPASDE